MKFLIGGLVAAIMVGFCSSAGHATEAAYPNEYLAALTQTCIEDGVSQEACACFVEGLATDLSFADFEAMNQAVQAERLHASMGQVARIMDGCNPPATPPVATVEPGYTDSYVANFMRDCAIEPTDTGYCLCAVSAIQRLVSFEDAIAYDRLNSWGRANEHPMHMEIWAAWFACADQTRSERLPVKRREP